MSLPAATRDERPGTGPVCGRCGGITFERVQRVSFFQRQIMPFFNRYPWRCVFCNRITYRRERKNSELFRG